MSESATPRPWNPDEPLAVRLARVIDPTKPWEYCQNEDPTWDAAAWIDWIEYENGKREDFHGSFELNSLDDLALVERRVVEADFAFAFALADLLGEVVGHRGSLEGYEWQIAFATAPQRAAALDALFTAHPDLYQRLTSAKGPNDG